MIGLTGSRDDHLAFTVLGFLAARGLDLVPHRIFGYQRTFVIRLVGIARHGRAEALGKLRGIPYHLKRARSVVDGKAERGIVDLDALVDASVARTHVHDDTARYHLVALVGWGRRVVDRTISMASQPGTHHALGIGHPSLGPVHIGADVLGARRGDQVVQAVIAAQRAMGYQSPDGVAGVEFQSFLFSKYSKKIKQK